MAVGPSQRSGACAAFQSVPSRFWLSEEASFSHPVNTRSEAFQPQAHFLKCSQYGLLVSYVTVKVAWHQHEYGDNEHGAQRA